MAGFFNGVMGDLNDFQERLLGPNYEYWNKVKAPNEMGMSDKGSLDTLARNVGGLVSYVELLVSGGGNASRVRGPMGNKFFLQTGGKCRDKSSGKKVERYVYVNNVPDGSIPYISAGLGGAQFSQLRGLVPGTYSKMKDISPFAIFQAFMMGTNPECQSLTMETIDANDNKKTETRHVAIADIKNMSPCWFHNNRNPITNKPCKMMFQNMTEEEQSIIKDIPPGLISTLFFAGISGISLYILYKIMEKQKK